MAALTAPYNNFELLHGGQFNENAIHYSFGCDTNAHLFGSPGLCWTGTPIDAYAALVGEVVYPTPEEEEDSLFGGESGSEFLLQLHGQQQQLPAPPTLVDSYKSSTVVEERYNFEHQELNQIGKQIQQHREAYFEEQLQHLADSPQICVSDESGLTVDGVTFAVDSEYGSELEIVHEPPPLNNKRLEKIEDPDESIEAEEVSVDLIQNRRPFQCGLAGCDRTFKNPQTMKMHHKTHYTDGSAVEGVELPTLSAMNSRTGGGGGQTSNKKIPSRCPKCRKTFVGLYELRRHYGRKHSEGEKPFGCRKCSKRFYIEVDVRDHEKLCGEPIECKCGLKFAFKCNLVAHKKAHPECLELPQSRVSHRTTTTATPAKYFAATTTPSNSSSRSTTTSDADSCRRSSKRRRRGSPESDSSTSRNLETYTVLTPGFSWLPEAKADRYDFDLPGGHLWSPHHDFANLSYFQPEPLLVGHSQSVRQSSSVDLLHRHPKFNALHDAMALLN